MNRAPAFKLLPACVAWFVTLLQVVGTLHFALVPHGYSAALGGVVHLHGAPRVSAASAVRAPAQPGPAVHADSASCAAERCLAADAPQHSPPGFALWLSGVVRFGEVRLLGEHTARVSEVRRLFLSAPKTSPPA